MNIPNALTLLRIFFVPLLVAALVQENWSLSYDHWRFSNDLIALCIFLVAALTDLLDGYLARRWNQVTTVGMLLDPIADKLLISSALIALVQVHRLPAWMAVIIVGREFAVSGLRSIAAEVGSVIAASDLGKAKMVFQVAAVGLLMASTDLPQLRPLATVAVWGVVLFALVSAVDYFRRFWGLLDEKIKARRRMEILEMERQRAAQKKDELRQRTGD
jgi:CDP-diacylglycerol---glycerol-3-phosphate 3-phosphatidyltransferase